METTSTLKNPYFENDIQEQMPWKLTVLLSPSAEWYHSLGVYYLPWVKQLNSITPLEYAFWSRMHNCKNSLKSITSFESRLVERHHSLGVCSSHSVNQMVERHHSPGVCHSQSNRHSLELCHSLGVRYSRSASSWSMLFTFGQRKIVLIHKCQRTSKISKQETFRIKK